MILRRLFGTVPALICVSVVLPGHSCFGQTAPPQAPPPASGPVATPATGPVVVGEKPDAPADKATPADKGAMDLTFHPDPKDVPLVPPSAPKPAGGGKTVPLAATPAAPKDVSAAYSSPSKPYVIGSLDVLEVQVWNSPNLSGIRDVGSDGMIAMPLIGEIRADGLTKEQLTGTIKEKLASSVFADPPEVTVQVLRVNSKRYYVFGAVNRPGEFPLIGPMTVLDAFANTGGFRDFAKTKAIYVLRGDKKLKFNFNEVSQGKHMEQNIQLENGDRIFVKE